jgi:hypothetical protein
MLRSSWTKGQEAFEEDLMEDLSLAGDEQGLKGHLLRLDPLQMVAGARSLVGDR